MIRKAGGRGIGCSKQGFTPLDRQRPPSHGVKREPAAMLRANNPGVTRPTGGEQIGRIVRRNADSRENIKIF